VTRASKPQKATTPIGPITFIAGHFLSTPRTTENALTPLTRVYIPIGLIESPARRVLSSSALRVFDRLVIEHCRRGGCENGALPCAYKDLKADGVYADAIARAIRELVAVGIVEVTRKGAGRMASLYRVTCFGVGRGKRATHDYERIATVEEAEALVAAARNNVSARAVANGHKAQRTAPIPQVVLGRSH
jgi:hypothetical protein